MCGIFGFSLKRPLDKQDIGIGKKALTLLQHRGPDGQGFWLDEEHGVFLGHTRLSILDLSNENTQPMARDEGVLTFNGEIYNYQALRKKLEHTGRSFLTRGDTEVVAQSINEWGVQAVEQFDGMFAFAHYKNGLITMATDYFGEKPLYILSTSEGIYFSSEITVLTTLFELSLDMTEEEVGLFAGLGFLPQPFTGYRNIKKIGPSQCVLYNIREHTLSIETYGDSINIRPEDRKKVIEKSDIKLFQERIIESVASRLEADVPVGVFLSAGIDSTLVASILKKELSKDNLCLSVKFNSKFVQDESERAKASAAYLGLNHVVLEQEEALADISELPFLLDIFGEPNDNLTVLSAYSMSLSARKHVKVALSGTGGDELFYGYNKYQGLMFIKALKHKFGSIKAFLKLVYPFKGLSAKVNRFINYLEIPDQYAYLLVKNYFGFEHLKQYPHLLEFVSKNYDQDSGDIVEAARNFDICHSLPNSYIPYMERGSMKAGLEVRCPFLNKELLELTNQFDASAFLAQGQKWLLKSILEQYLPKEYFNFSKMGFINPRQEFMSRNFRTESLNEIARKNGLANQYTNITKSGLTDIILRYALIQESYSRVI